MVSAAENWKYDFLEHPRPQFEDLEIIGEIKGWSARRKKGMILLSLNSEMRAKVGQVMDQTKDNKPGSDEDQYNSLKTALIKLYDNFNKPLDGMSEFMKLFINPGER
ncbi:hypothetical protein RF11_01988 [Thelohanellus kitauei]|uniref:Uncharacterized protein n=1 Tax=Thelohanellus kitauei TaxID=669202 RepID=A0A0C2N283_THEKT|nr:hypothetical protein RF11_01988 [Thelohanellus kitauei]